MSRLPIASLISCALLASMLCGPGGCRKGGDGSKPADAAGVPASATPREVALAFAKAVQSGDMAAAKNLSVGDDRDYQALAALSGAWKSMETMIAAAKATGPDSAEFVAGVRRELDLSADLDAEAQAGQEKIDGDAATVVADEKDEEPVKLKKVDGRWKVDLTPTLEAKHMLEANSVKGLQEMQQKADRMTLEIKTGKASLGGRRPGTRRPPTTSF